MNPIPLVAPKDSNSTIPISSNRTDTLDPGPIVAFSFDLELRQMAAEINWQVYCRPQGAVNW